MAEGYLRHVAADRFEVASAGTRPRTLNPKAVAVMRENGLDISGHRSKSVDEFLGQQFDYVITVCDSARESCPMFPGTGCRLHFSFEDPAAALGSKEEQIQVFRRVCNAIVERLQEFARSEGRMED